VLAVGWEELFDVTGFLEVGIGRCAGGDCGLSFQKDFGLGLRE
jgi:hypothetical protein